MAFHNLLADGKADAYALVLLTGMESLECAEYVLIVARLNPNTVIAYEQRIRLIACRKPTDFDALAWGVIELDRIHNEILKDLPEKGWLSVNGGPITTHNNLDVRRQIERRYEFLEKRSDVDCFCGVAPSAGPKEFQQSFDQFFPLPHSLVNAVKIRFLVSIEGRFEVFAQKVGVVVDGSQGRFEVMERHVSVVGKLLVNCFEGSGLSCKILMGKAERFLDPLALTEFPLQLFGCPGEFGRPLFNTFFQFFVGLLQRFLRLFVLDGIADRTLQQGGPNLALVQIIRSARLHRCHVYIACTLAREQNHWSLAAVSDGFRQELQPVALAKKVVDKIHIVLMAHHLFYSIIISRYPFEREFACFDFQKQVSQYDIVVLIVVNKKHPDRGIVHVSLRSVEGAVRQFQTSTCSRSS